MCQSRRPLAVALAAGLFAFTSHAIAGDAASSSGEFTTGTGTHAVVDALALLDWNGSIQIDFSDQPFDRAQFNSSANGRWTSYDFMGHPGVMLEVFVYAEEGLTGIATRQNGGATPDYDYGAIDDATLVFDVRTDERIAGRLVLADRHEVRFDLPLHHQDNLHASRTARPLPADGGEPGAALLALSQAVARGDFEAIIAASPQPDASLIRSRLEAASESGNPDAVKEMQEEELSIVRSTMPVKLTITGGRSDSEHANVDFDGALYDGAQVTGKAEVNRVDGRWIVQRIGTRKEVERR